MLEDQCSPTESCIPARAGSPDGTCDCLPGTVRHNDTVCRNATRAKSSPDPQTSSLVGGGDSTSGGSTAGYVIVGIAVPALLISVVMGAVYFGRKHDLYGYVRNKVRQRRSNYDEVMIGQDFEDDDDPPLR